MKKQILTKLKAIAKAAKVSKMTGRVYLNVSDISVKEYDTLIESITEYPRYQNQISISTKLTVLIIID